MSEGLIPARVQEQSLPAVAFADGVGTPALAEHPLDRPIAAVRRYKWLIMAIFGLGVIGGLVGRRFVAGQYQTRATIWIQAATPQQASGRTGPIRSAELLGSSAAWIELFRSYRIVDEVVRKLALYLQPKDLKDSPLFAGFTLADRFLPGEYDLKIDRVANRWTLRNAAGVEIERGAQADSVGKKIGFKWQLPSSAFDGEGEREVIFTVATPRETSIGVLSRLDNRLALGSNFLWLIYQDRDPELAAKTLNTWLAEYIRVAAELKKRNLVEYANILDEQLRYAEQATQAAEQAYQRFRVNTITLPTEGGPVAAGVESTRDPALASFFEQKIAYDNLRNDREALERSMAKAASGAIPYEGLLLIPSVAQSPGAEALREAFKQSYETQAKLRVERQTFTDEFPSVKLLKATADALQSQTIPQLAGQVLAQLRERERDYERRIAGASRELQEIPPRTIEEMRLHRAVTVAEGLYTKLKSSYAEAKLGEASATADVSVLDTAVAPLEAMKDRSQMVLLLAIVGGLGAALGLAILLDRIDGKFRYPSQAASDLGLGIAGTVPRVPKSGISSGSPEQVVQFVESFRSLRMHVMHSSPGSKITVAVTSAAPSDGKSLVSVNLALSFAEAGLRTIVIDGDTRRGALHKVFNLPVGQGLTDYLAGTGDEQQVIRATPHANLWAMSCGKRNPRSPELLTSPRLRDLVARLSQSFDVVIFDTPPFAAGIDGFAISAAAGGVLMVLRLGQTERRLAAAKLALLDNLPVRVMGAVLNGVQLTGEYQYYAYAARYAADDDDSGGELIGSSTG
jgi:succinoglycan biosynthesis transport protein ExoP